MADTAQSKWITASEMIDRIVDALPVRQDEKNFPRRAHAAANIEHASIVEDLTLYGYTVTDPVRPILIPPEYWELFRLKVLDVLEPRKCGETGVEARRMKPGSRRAVGQSDIVSVIAQRKDFDVWYTSRTKRVHHPDLQHMADALFREDPERTITEVAATLSKKGIPKQKGRGVMRQETIERLIDRPVDLPRKKRRKAGRGRKKANDQNT